MNLIEATLSKLFNIQYYLRNLDPGLYKEPLEILSFASIGEHTRHILEFYQCLLNQSAEGCVNYDLRVRDQLIQEDPAAADQVLTIIIESIPKYHVDQKLRLQISYDQDQAETITVATSLERELAYNLEHVIHHLAIIKIGLSVVSPGLALPDGFGVAPSTMRFKSKQCAQ